MAVMAPIAANPAAQEISREHPNLSLALRSIIDEVDDDATCRLPSDLTVELESLLEWSFDEITVQTEADELIAAYVRCVPPDRAAQFLANLLPETERPSVRVFLLRGLAATGHKVAVDSLVGHTSNNDVYMTLVSSDGVIDVQRTVADAAASLLQRLFPEVEASSPEGWSEWWRESKEPFTKVRGLPYN